MRNILLILAVSLLPLKMLAQEDITQSQLASKYFFNQEYEKAVSLYKELYSQNYSKVYFNRYIKCLKKLERLEQAATVAKNQIRRAQNDLSYYVDLGLIYELQNNYDKAEETYKKAINSIRPSRNMIINLGNAFVSNGRYEYAESLYKKAAGMLSRYDFHYELASVYMMQRKYEAMVQEYMEVLRTNPQRKDDVQNRLQYIADNETTANIHSILRRELLKRVRKNPRSNVYYRMLIWLYEQQKDFRSALRQARALDMRQDLQGKYVFDVSKIALSNEAYKVAGEGFRYIVDKGRSMPFYWPARLKLLDVMFNRLTRGNRPTRAELLDIEQAYATTLNEMNMGQRGIETMKKLAHIRAFYLDKNKEALKTIERALNFAHKQNHLIAACQLEKADIMVKSGDVWEAALLYAKIEKDNKNSPYGFQAKFRKARLAYFTGDFEWAKAQLDVLKASTSKLIANDSFKLSELIDDNTEQDTAGHALKIYARADLLRWQRKDSLALLTLDSIRRKFPGHAITDEVFFQKASMYKQMGRYEKAVTFYEKTFQEYGSDIYGDEALFELASLYQEQFEEYARAKELYKRLLEDYPGSIYVTESRQRFRKLRGDL